MVDDLDQLVRWGDEDDPILEGRRLLDDPDRQGGPSGEDLAEMARPSRIEVLGDDDRRRESPRADWPPRATGPRCPPADDPITTSWESVVSCFTTMPHSSHPSRAQNVRSNVLHVPRTVPCFHPQQGGCARVSSVVTSGGVWDLLLPSAGWSDFWGNRRSRSGRFPPPTVDECSGPRRSFVTLARRPPGGGLRALPLAPRRDRRNSPDPSSNEGGISSSRASRPARHPVRADQVGRPSAFPSGIRPLSGMQAPRRGEQPDGEGLHFARGEPWRPARRTLAPVAPGATICRPVVTMPRQIPAW